MSRSTPFFFYLYFFQHSISLSFTARKEHLHFKILCSLWSYPYIYDSGLLSHPPFFHETSRCHLQLFEDKEVQIPSVTKNFLQEAFKMHSMEPTGNKAFPGYWRESSMEWDQRGYSCQPWFSDIVESPPTFPSAHEKFLLSDLTFSIFIHVILFIKTIFGACYKNYKAMKYFFYHALKFQFYSQSQFSVYPFISFLSACN